MFEGPRIDQRIDQRIERLHIELDDGNAGWLLAAPGMPVLTAISNDLRRQSVEQSIGLRFVEHRDFANAQRRWWQPYENMERGVIPDDALMASGGLGRFYYLPDLRVIDIFGLTDATVARNPVIVPNRQRVIAHERLPPPGYLEQRGVNFTVHAAASSEAQALRRGHYAVQVGPGLWMPFNAADPDWVAASFAGHDLRARIETMSVGDYLAELVGDHPPSIRADFDVYLSDNTLIYVKEPCARADAAEKFFLHLLPVDVNDLPGYRRRHGFDNRDFNFYWFGGILDGRCMAEVALPEYDIARISTGQYVPVEGGYHHLWEGDIRLNE